MPDYSTPRFPDEDFRFMGWAWRVNRAWELVGAQEPQLVLPTTGLASNLGMIAIHEDRLGLPEIDLSVPLLAIMAPFGKSDDGSRPDWIVFVIDGWHRVAKAERQGVAELPVIVLTHEQEEAIRHPLGVWNAWRGLAEDAGPCALEVSGTVQVGE